MRDQSGRLQHAKRIYRWLDLDRERHWGSCSLGLSHAKGDSEFKEGDKMDIKGASELSDQVDNVFLLSRNKAKEDESVKANPNEKLVQMPDALLTCRKQRHGEWEGKIALWFDKKSMQYVAFDGARPIDFLRAYTDQAA
jgi:hypothetical protein